MSYNPDDHIIIVAYDPNWKRKAEKEIEAIKNLFVDADWLIEIQHIGSTAIPGLAAKPVIDFLIGVRSLDEAQQAIKPIEDLGYVYWYDNPNKEKMFFVKGMPPFGTGRTHHIHIVKHEGDYWQARLLFRDYLRKHPDEMLRYAKLKQEKMAQHPEDREAYTDAKGEYVASVLKKAGYHGNVRR
jgi:GrpB-like predicted nucleotidyltransferase (UPF0157 family)